MGGYITYAGVQLPIMDPAGVAKKFQDSYQHLDDARIFGRANCFTSSRLQPRGPSANASGLSRPNETEPPRPKINCLQWPSGATRWARFYALADRFMVQKLAAATTNGTQPSSLVLSDGVTTLNVSDMFMLPPRPISPGDITSLNGLYIVPIVDQRYYWQFITTDDLEIKADSTWATLFTTLGTQLGVTVNTDSVSGYEKPDAVELTRRYENVAAILEAAAISCGQRVTLDINGTLSTYRWDSPTLVDQNLNSNRPRITAGGTRSVPAPAYVRCTHRKYYYGGIDPNGAKHKVDTAPTDSSLPTIASLYRVIHSTAFADFSTEVSTTTPDNNSTLAPLAAKIAADYYASLTRRYDCTYAGIASWQPCAFDDWIEWSLFRQNERGEYDAHTRVQSIPDNFGWDEQLSQFSTMPLFPVVSHGYLNADLAYNDYTGVSFNIWQANSSGTEVDSGHAIKIRPFAIASGKKLASGQYLHIAFQPGDNYDGNGYKCWWYAISSENCNVNV